MLIVNAVAMLTRKVGDYIYRVQQPSIAMGKKGRSTVITVSTTSPWFETLCQSADILVLHLLSEHDLLPIIDERKRRRRPTIYELSDNILALHEGVGIKGWFSDPVNLALAFQYMKMADVVQVTGAGLADHFRFINSRIVVFENHVAELGMVDRLPSNRVVLGWAGSSGHKQDIESVRDVIRQIMQIYPQVNFAFMGDEETYSTLSTALPVGRSTYTPAGTLDEYFCFLQKLDIGIAPLQDNLYNRCRSDVKFLEYASRGVVPVLSSLTPYENSVRDGENGFLYDSPQHLLSILSILVCDTNLRERVSREAYTYVKQYRLEELHAERRLIYYSNLIEEESVHSILPAELPLVRHIEGVNYFEVPSSLGELLILKGIKQEIDGAAEDATRTYQLATEQSPDYSLAWFWFAFCLFRKGNPEALQLFDEVIKRNPHSLRATWLKAKILQKRGDPIAAISEISVLLKSWPDYAPAAALMAELLESHEVYVEAKHWYNEALRSNPFYSPAALGLGKIYDKLGQKEQAGIAFGIAADLAPSWAEAQYIMACWCFSSNNLEQAIQYCHKTLLADLSHLEALDMIGKIEKRI